MVNQSDRRILFLLSGLAAFITLGVAGYSLANLSVYQPGTPEKLLPGAASQDIVSLVAAIGLIVCILFIRRGSGSTWLIWVGLLGYLFYAYALYNFERLYNPLFLFYIAILGLTVYSLIGFFMRADLTAIRAKDGRNPLRRGAAVLFLVLVAMFVFLWLSILLPAMRSRIPPDGSTIFVLDLAFFLPLLTIEAGLLFKKAALGDALVIPILIKVGALGLSVLLGTLIAPWFGQELDAASVGIYAILGLGPLLFVIPFLRSMSIGAVYGQGELDS